MTIAFLHIPKCAGSTMVSVINRMELRWWHVPSGLYIAEHDAFIGNYETSLRGNKDKVLAGEYELLFGHFSARDLLRGIGHKTDIRFATILRDPVERMVSEY